MRHPHEHLRGGRRRGLHLELHVPVEERRIVAAARQVARERLRPAVPPLPQRRHCFLERLWRGFAPRPVVGRFLLHLPAVHGPLGRTRGSSIPLVPSGGVRSCLQHSHGARSLPESARDRRRRADARRSSRERARRRVRHAARRLLRGDDPRAGSRLSRGGAGRAHRLRHEGVRERRAAAAARGGGRRRRRLDARRARVRAGGGDSRRAARLPREQQVGRGAARRGRGGRARRARRRRARRSGLPRPA